MNLLMFVCAMAGFVGLFIVFSLGLVGYLLTWFTKRETSWQQFMESLNKRWQETINARNVDWQRWLEDENNRQCLALKEITESMNRLTDKLADHDGKVEGRFTDAISELHKVKTIKTK